ncbi:hypothetical protein Q0M25_13850, partial [Staphylococcus aureus]|nr:hypothetical protein [Staphylococcus aureus]
ARFLLAHAAELDARLLDLNGGTLRNAIPREAFATLAVPAAKAAELKSAANAYLAVLKNELSAVEKNITVLVEATTSD